MRLSNNSAHPASQANTHKTLVLEHILRNIVVTRKIYSHRYQYLGRNTIGGLPPKLPGGEKSGEKSDEEKEHEKKNEEENNDA